MAWRRPQSADTLTQAFFDTCAQFPIGAAVFTIDGQFLRANATLCRMLGYTEEELKQRTHLDVMHADDREEASHARSEAVSGKSKPRLNERRYLRKDGSTLWAHVGGAVPRDSAGRPLYTAAMIIDITELKRASRTAEQRFRRMVEMGSDWYWMQDDQFRFVEVPGLPAPDVDTDVVIGKARWDITGLAPMQESWKSHRARLQRHESFTDFVLLRYKGTGELRYLSRNQKALEESEERYRLLFEVQPQPMWVVDASNLQFLAVNGAAIAFYGYSKEEFLAMTADQIRPAEDVGNLIKAFEDRSRDYRARIHRHRKKNGELIHVKVVSFNLEFSGRPARLGVIYDVTEQMREQQKRAAGKPEGQGAA